MDVKTVSMYLIKVVIRQTGGKIMSEERIKGLIKEYLELDSEIKSQQILADQIKEQLKDELTQRGVEELEIDSHIVRYRDVLSNIFCTSKFKEKYPEIYTAFVRQVPSKKFSIC